MYAADGRVHDDWLTCKSIQSLCTLTGIDSGSKCSFERRRCAILLHRGWDEVGVSGSSFCTCMQLTDECMTIV